MTRAFGTFEKISELQWETTRERNHERMSITAVNHHTTINHRP